MKYLTLIRHSKSDWSVMGLNDFERSLNRRGETDALKMGKKLKELNLKPNKIYCSSAVRTTRTAELLVEQLDYLLGEVNYSDDLYEASVRTLLGFVNQLNDQFHDVTIISHNPAITYLAEYLTGEALGHVPTTGVVRMSFGFDEWKLISEKTAELVYFIYPKKLQTGA